LYEIREVTPAGDEKKRFLPPRRAYFWQKTQAFFADLDELAANAFTSGPESVFVSEI
jgi:hypothetical protein